MLPPLAVLRDPRGRQPHVLLLGDLCARAPTFGVPPPAVTGPLGEMSHMYSHKKRSEALGWGSGCVAGWILMVACDLLR